VNGNYYRLGMRGSGELMAQVYKASIRHTVFLCDTLPSVANKVNNDILYISKSLNFKCFHHRK
jgi:hypothetical protein